MILVCLFLARPIGSTMGPSTISLGTSMSKGCRCYMPFMTCRIHSDRIIITQNKRYSSQLVWIACFLYVENLYFCALTAVTLTSATPVPTRPNGTDTTTAPCYPGDIMYRDNHILSIKDLDGNRQISVLSLRTDTTGVTFSKNQQPTILVEINYKLVAHIISISVPTTNGATNVNQIELAFYGTDGKIILNSYGEPWIVETTPGVTTVCFLHFFSFL